MSTRVVDRVSQWDERQFEGGYRGLSTLAEAEFSGVVQANGVHLYMARGVGVGIFGGDISAFEGSARALEAPSPALPLLAVMQETAGSPRDSFYSEKTPLSEVDETLSNGGFTGYVELSENVLSGDYYVVYHGGRSMSVAFVGQSERLMDGQEAFETANDEVGIYEVYPASIEPVEWPTPQTQQPTESQQANSTGHRDQVQTATESTEQQASEAAQRASGSQAPSGQADVESDPQSIPSLDPGWSQRPGQAPPPTGTEPTATAGQADTGNQSVASAQQEPPQSQAPAQETDDQAPPTTDQSRADSEQTAPAEQTANKDATTEPSETSPAEATTAADSPVHEAEAARDIDPSEANDETVVFIRYRARADGTLEDAYDGSIDRDQLTENLQLEIYGGFDEPVAVDGTPYDVFVTETLGYRFLEWLVGDLVFEIQATETEDTLRVLYDALPRIDRAVFNDTVEVDGLELPFDVVVRDRRERPLFVATLDTDSGAVTDAEITDLVTGANDVSETSESLAGAVYVTQTFFEGSALHVVDEVTDADETGSQSQKSFVETTAEGGYHLCLLEARGEIPHLVVPEL